MRRFLLAATAVLGCVLGCMAPAAANVVVLDFAGLNGVGQEQPLNYYNGGKGGAGSGPGTNYGISFSPNAISCNPSAGKACTVAEIPGGPGANTIFFKSLTGNGIGIKSLEV